MPKCFVELVRIGCVVAVSCFALTAYSQSSQNWCFRDVGAAGVAGDVSYDSSSDAFTVNGAGNGYGTGGDILGYAYMSQSGNTEIIARIVSIASGSGAAGSVMMRESLDAGSVCAMVTVLSGSSVQFGYRGVMSGAVSIISGITSTAPTWVRLARNGSVFTGYQSSDGVNWTVIGSGSFAMADNFSVGMAVSSGTAGTLGTGVFDHVSALSNIPQLESNLKLWLRSDVNVTLSSSNQISQWQDQSGSGNNVFQSNGGNQPLLIAGAINGESVAQFDGSSDYLAFSGSNSLTDYSAGMAAFVVAKFTNAGSWQRLFDLGNGAASNNIVLSRSGTSSNLAFLVYTGGSQTLLLSANNAILQNQYQIFEVDANNSLVTLYANGQALAFATGTIPAATDLLPEN